MIITINITYCCAVGSKTVIELLNDFAPIQVVTLTDLP